MDIKQLEYFLALMQREHISGTADLLHISQPALSKSIAKLEEEVGVPLFDRHSNRITLNEYGRTFASYVTKSLSLLQSGLLATREIMYDTNGVLSISCHAYCDILLPIVTDYNFLNPNVKVVVARHADQENVASENTDFILCSGQDGRSFTESSNSWVDQKLFQERHYLLISPRYRAYPAGCNELSIEDLKDDTFVVTWENSPFFSDITFKICQTAGFVPRAPLSTNNFLFKVGLVGEGRAIAVLPECCVKTAQRLYPDVRAFSIKEYNTTRSIYLMRRKKLLMSEAAQDFWSFVLEYYGLDPDKRD